MKTFAVLKRADKSYLYLVRYEKDSTVIIEYVYNSISSTYMGSKLDGFVENIRGLLRAVPNFIEDFEGSNPERSLLELGFVQVEPTELDKLVYMRLEDVA